MTAGGRQRPISRVLLRIACVAELAIAGTLFGLATLVLWGAFQGPPDWDTVGDGPAYLALGGALLVPIAIGFAISGIALLKSWRPAWGYQLAPVLMIALTGLFLWLLDRA